jgi:type IV pilus assembly protein PilQ
MTRISRVLIVVLSAYCAIALSCRAQETAGNEVPQGSAGEGIALPEEAPAAVEKLTEPAIEAVSTAPREAKEPAPLEIKPVEPSQKEGAVTLDFKDADIQNVLRVLAYKSGVNIVASKEVIGTITIRLVDVPWEQALAVILSTYGFAYEREGNIITVSTMDALKIRRENQKQLADIEGVTSEVFNLQFLDAADAKKMLEPQLSPQGKISVLEITGQKGWEFGAAKAGATTDEEGKAERERRPSRSRSLIVTDTPTYLDRIKKVLKDIDVKPSQVLIEARIMEVNKDVLKDLGVEFATGTRLQAHGTDRTQGNINAEINRLSGEATGRNYSESDTNVFTPANFVPKATNLTAINAGVELLYTKLFGNEFEILIHALEEDVRTNTLSAPRILTLSGQEAVILVGQKYPIVESSVSGTSGTATVTLAYYQDIGIQLYVVPQITGDDRYINMIVHPVVSARDGVATVGGDNKYPILTTREAETQVLMGDGETIVIGGLLKDVKSQGKIGIPFLSDIPIIGGLFTRRTNDVEKIDLLIFVTARIVKSGELTEQDISMVKEAMDAGQPNIATEKVEDKKKEDKKDKPKAEGYTKANNKGYLKKR